MNCSWLIHNKNDSLILFFNGWGMDKNVIAHLSTGNFDIIEFNDYTDLSLNPHCDVSSYKSVTVIAWSLGVYAAAHVIHQQKIIYAKAIAINGTPYPVDDNRGIPVTVFESTLNTLSLQNLDRFFLRICGDRTTYSRFMTIKPKRTFDSQRTELESIYQQILKAPAPPVRWDTAIISLNDRIFPAVNQKKAWTNVSTLEFDWHHYPFFNATSWDDLIHHQHQTHNA